MNNARGLPAAEISYLGRRDPVVSAGVYLLAPFHQLPFHSRPFKRTVRRHIEVKPQLIEHGTQTICELSAARIQAYLGGQFAPLTSLAPLDTLQGGLVMLISTSNAAYVQIILV